MLTYEKKLEKQRLKYKKRKEKATLKSNANKYKKEIKEIENNYLEEPEWVEKWNTSKKLVYLLIINCTIIEIYSMIVMVHLQDLSALSVLITTIIGESLSYGIYCLKAFFSKKEEENLKFEREKFEDEVQDNELDDNYLTERESEE